MTLIHLAAKAGQTTAIRYLLENRRLNVNAKVAMRFCNLCSIVIDVVTNTSATVFKPCELRGCKNRPGPFPVRMS